MAQLDSALDFESNGCGFESRQECIEFIYFCLITIYKIFRDGVVGNISACHADARGSIPRRGVLLKILWPSG